MNKKTTVAVLFGGPSVEHDVSILTGLQIIEAMDATKYAPLPVYIDQQGSWWYGQELLERKNYHFSTETKNKLEQIDLPVGCFFEDKPFLNIKKRSIFSKNQKLHFDIAFIAFHGEIGETGSIQGVFEVAQIPYTGTRVLGSSVFMNKAVAKSIFRNASLPVLSDIVIRKPFNDGILDITKIIANIEVSFPVCVKPCNLGSSICVHKVKSNEELHTAILEIFRVDTEAMIEPFIENLVEYNISVTKAFDDIINFSAIELPIQDGDLLSFDDKYLSQGGISSKLSMNISEGLSSATRELNPKSLTTEQKQIIRNSAQKAFELVAGCGAPRIDFLCDKKTGKLWLSEVNPIPGSLGYYLWEAGNPKINFTELIDTLINEGFSEHKKLSKKVNLKNTGSSIFPQRI